MNKAIRILLAITCLLLIVIGVLCYNISKDAFFNYMLFAVPIAILRLAKAVITIKLERND